MEMPTGLEFHYGLRSAAGGYRPGAHAGTAVGAGQAFASHSRLFDRADPRRIDIRASVRNVRREWLVRTFQQRSSIPVYAIVDVSASMHFGTPRSKLDIVGDFVESLGFSTFRAGDTVGMRAFDDKERLDLYVPPRQSRGSGADMAAKLRHCEAASMPAQNDHTAPRAVRDTLGQLAGKRALIFLVSDFHWPLDTLSSSLDLVSRSTIVPMVIWDRAESTPPARSGLLTALDSESGASRAVWMNDAARQAWRAAVENRRLQIASVFASRGARPYFVEGDFKPEGLSHYFLEERA